MKKQLSLLLTVVLLFAATLVQAQTVPQSFNYQAVLRDNAGAILASQTVDMRFTIRDSTAAGPIVYRETMQDTTTAQGLISHAVGTGTVDQGAFLFIEWAVAAKFLQVEVSLSGGPYVNLGTQKLVSVPYALNADRANFAVYAGNAMTADHATTAGDNIAFLARTAVAQPLTGTNVIDIDFEMVEFNDGNAYNSNSGRFTAPSAGLYHFDVSLEVLPSQFGSIASVQILVSNVTQAGERTFLPYNGGQLSTVASSFTTKLSAGQQVRVVMFIIGDGQLNNSSTFNSFSGYKVR